MTLRHDHVEMHLQHHQGEARAWHVGPEQWVPVDAAGSAVLLELEKSGQLTYEGTTIGRTQQQRTQEFYASRYAWSEETHIRYGQRTLMEFGQVKRPVARGQDGQPDLDDAMSTLIVRGAGPPGQSTPRYWLRKVHVITLSELLMVYKDDATWKFLYETWLEGSCVFRSKDKHRGAPGKYSTWYADPKRQTHLAAQSQNETRLQLIPSESWQWQSNSTWQSDSTWQQSRGWCESGTR